MSWISRFDPIETRLADLEKQLTTLRAQTEMLARALTEVDSVVFPPAPEPNPTKGRK